MTGPAATAQAKEPSGEPAEQDVEDGEAAGLEAAATVAGIEAATAEATRAFAGRLGRLLEAGDLVILSGELGAGKTTFTQGLAAGLGVRGPVTSPTFVIAHVHPPLAGGDGADGGEGADGGAGAGTGRGTPLVHVDAYRLGSLAELDDLDLDASVEEAVTVVEWGEGKAEVLSSDRIVVRIERARGADAFDDDRRVITVAAHGEALTERLRTGLASL